MKYSQSPQNIVSLVSKMLFLGIAMQNETKMGC
jgi:hypothetical protein